MSNRPSRKSELRPRRSGCHRHRLVLPPPFRPSRLQGADEGPAAALMASNPFLCILPGVIALRPTFNDCPFHVTQRIFLGFAVTTTVLDLRPVLFLTVLPTGARIPVPYEPVIVKRMTERPAPSSSRPSVRAGTLAIIAQEHENRQRPFRRPANSAQVMKPP